MLRDDSKLWYAEDIIAESQAYVKLDKMLRMMQKNWEDIEEEGQGFDVVTELFKEGQEYIQA